MRVLVLGATGMLGHAVFRGLTTHPGYDAWGTLRSADGRRYFAGHVQHRLLTAVDVLDQPALVAAMARVRPAVVINCVGLIRHLEEASDPLRAIPVNALAPHHLARLCGLAGARLVHVSTDCVFSGRHGGYSEDDPPDATDLYGRSKGLGELHGHDHAITLRTSIIGHELRSKHALVEWFLSSQGPVPGYANAVFSGLPTVELAAVIMRHILPRPDLYGLYNVAAQPIGKDALLRLIAKVYGKTTPIHRDEQVVVDRSLNPARFQAATGYKAAAWPQLVERMHAAR